jgi:cytochrome P450
MANMPYGPWWRRHRRVFHEYFYRNAVTKYQPIQKQEVQAFLRRLLVTPDDFLHHIRQLVSCLIFESAGSLIISL